MKALWVLVASVAVVLVLSLAVLEVVGERVRVEPLSVASSPGDEAMNSWQDAPMFSQMDGWLDVPMVSQTHGGHDAPRFSRESSGGVADVREARLPPE